MYLGRYLVYTLDINEDKNENFHSNKKGFIWLSKGVLSRTAIFFSCSIITTAR